MPTLLKKEVKSTCNMLLVSTVSYVNDDEIQVHIMIRHIYELK